MKYKYKLREQEEETNDIETTTGSNSSEKNDLVLAPKGEKILDDILDILKNPKKEYLKGVFAPISENERDIKLNIYGYPATLGNSGRNKKLKEEQIQKYGKLFYKQVEEVTGLKFKKLKTSGFPELDKENSVIVDKYINLSKNKVSSGVKWEELKNEAAVKIITDNLSISEKTINTILSNAGLKNNVDYTLKRKVIDENINKLRSFIKEEIFKLIKQK